MLLFLLVSVLTESKELFNLLLIMSLGAISKRTTRSNSNHFMVGDGIEQFSKLVLPTSLNVVRRRNFLFEQAKSKPTNKLSDGQKNAIYNTIAQEVIDIWLLANQRFEYKIKPKKKIAQMVKKLCDKILDETRKNKPRYLGNPEKIQQYLSQNTYLFLITTCQCFNDLRIFFLEQRLGRKAKPEDLDPSWCDCPLVAKIPEEDFEFFVQQVLLVENGLTIGSQGDLKISKEIQAENERAQKKREREEKQQRALNDKKLRESASFKSVNPKKLFDSDSSSLSSLSSDCSEPKPSTRRAPKCTYDYPFTMSYAERQGDGDRKVVGYINSVLRDLDIYDLTKFVSTQKIKGMRVRLGNELLEEHHQNVGHVCLFFDGKKNKNLLEHCKSELEENITVISQPSAKYLHHFNPVNGQGETIGKMMYGVILTYDSESSILCIGCDGTPPNTSPDVGAVRTIEDEISREVQWDIW